MIISSQFDFAESRKAFLVSSPSPTWTYRENNHLTCPETLGKESFWKEGCLKVWEIWLKKNQLDFNASSHIKSDEKWYLVTLHSPLFAETRTHSTITHTHLTWPLAGDYKPVQGVWACVPVCIGLCVWDASLRMLITALHWELICKCVITHQAQQQ